MCTEAKTNSIKVQEDLLSGVCRGPISETFIRLEAGSVVVQSRDLSKSLSSRLVQQINLWVQLMETSNPVLRPRLPWDL
jgi:hypothetical protein